MTRAALGLRVHSGWAAAVVVAGDPRSPAAITRRRIELVDHSTRDAKQPYHAAAEMDPKDAEKFIHQAIERTALHALHALSELIDGVRKNGHSVSGCGMLLASGRPLPALAATLASHALIHTAEGELFRNALANAARQQKLPVTAVRERDLYASAAGALGLPVDRLREHTSAMGRAVGSPWRQDEKLAALVAWLALVSRK